jgi:hypothetical protein
VKFFALFSDTCWLCDKPMHKNEGEFNRLNRRIADGRTSRPTTCFHCWSAVAVPEPPRRLAEAA